MTYDELLRENVRLRAMVRFNRNIIDRNNQQMALRCQRMREFREWDRKEAKRDLIDAFILGLGFGIIIAIGIAGLVVYAA